MGSVVREIGSEYTQSKFRSAMSTFEDISIYSLSHELIRIKTFWDWVESSKKLSRTHAGQSSSVARQTVQSKKSMEQLDAMCRKGPDV